MKKNGRDVIWGTNHVSAWREWEKYQVDLVFVPADNGVINGQESFPTYE